MAATPPQIDPAEPVTDPQQHLLKLRSPDTGPHIVLDDQHNSDHKPPVTNSRHMTTRQLSTLRNQPLASGNSEVQLEYQGLSRKWIKVVPDHVLCRVGIWRIGS
ncbi:hypothetical protein SNL152K_10097 [Streptomyces sp. NL15-2K]|nr:hypothetical protein SNL152K_10097 [Streptomyces sp. NL15-2K]